MTSDQMDSIPWGELEGLASRLSESGTQPGSVPNNQWAIIEQALRTLLDEQDWNGVLHLRKIFDILYARDTVTGLPILMELDQRAIDAARRLENKAEIGHLLGAKGHNLHRQGYHRDAIKAFDESVSNFRAIGEDSAALENYYMTSLCYRALGNRKKARQIIEDVLESIDADDPWRANPLQVMAWLAQDEGNLTTAEALLRQALILYRQSAAADMLITGALADLGEVVGILGRTREAGECFQESLSILHKNQGQYDRQEARTLLKYSELLIHQKDYQTAGELLNLADDEVSKYGHYYDLLWQIELAKAYILLRQWHIFACAKKLRSVLRIRRHLGLPKFLLFQYVIKRFVQRILRGSPRR
jgi:tetratricopeptide (TPR) repeat protein